MNTWIEHNKVILYQGYNELTGYPWKRYAIPVDKLTELFSKEGEKLAREMYSLRNKNMGIIEYTENSLKQKGFIEAWNIQQVKIEALRAEIKNNDSAYKSVLESSREVILETKAENAALREELNSLIKEGYNGQNKIIDALRAESEGKDLEIDALTDTIAQLNSENVDLRAEVERLKEMTQRGIEIKNKINPQQ